MKVVLYSRPEAKQFAALAEGCQTIGHKVVWQRPGVWQSGDIIADAGAVVVHGMSRTGGDIARQYQDRKVPVWILELPRIRTEPNAWGFYLDTVHYVPDKGFRKPVTPGLIEDRKPETVVVCGQLPGDLAHGMPMGAWDAWAREQVRNAREVTGLKVVYRQHPHYNAAIPSDKYGADEISDSRDSILREALENAAVLICHNSTSGWEAIDAGVPVFATATGEHRPGYKDYCIESLDDLKPLSKARRREALERAASSQWTMKEFRSGAAAERCFGSAMEAAA